MARESERVISPCVFIVFDVFCFFVLSRLHSGTELPVKWEFFLFLSWRAMEGRDMC